jgi:UDP-galactopyranose mutase
MIMKDYDYLIVGAGISGLVVAERMARAGYTSLVVDKRDHIGGNCYDYYDAAGVLIHKYGPHYFRASSDRITNYLSQFTEWMPTEYNIRSYTQGKLWNFPINLNTFETFLGRPSTTEEFEAWIKEKRIPIENPQNSEEVIISQVGWELYEIFFKGYTKKQWRMDPKELDKSVCGRIPIRTNRDDRYLAEPFQALPKAGYTAMFQRMIDSMGDKVEIRLNTCWEDVREQVQYQWLVYTGPIDKYFKDCYGPLPYRSLRFEHESFTLKQLSERESVSGKVGFWQPAMQINYPDEAVPFTRIVEIKHATRQDTPNTTIVREFPEDFGPGKEPYYPVPFDESKALYQQYKELAEAERNASFIGRLATYRYYNMDQVVGMSLVEADKILERLRSSV